MDRGLLWFREGLPGYQGRRAGFRGRTARGDGFLAPIKYRTRTTTTAYRCVSTLIYRLIRLSEPHRFPCTNAPYARGSVRVPPAESETQEAEDAEGGLSGVADGDERRVESVLQE